MADDLAISVVNHSNPGLLRNCLASLLDGGRQGCQIRVWVVDNAVVDRAVLSDLAVAFPQVTWVLNDRPLGFSHNHNQIVARFLADPDAGRHLCILNDDTVVHPRAMAQLLDHLDSHPEVGIVGPRLLNSDGTVQDAAFNDVTVSRLLIGSLLLPQCLMWLKRCAVNGVAQAGPSPADADWLLGACMVLRREALAAVGPLDQTLSPRANGEEIDWCIRFRQAGWRVVHVPAAIVTHVGGQSLAASETIEGAWVSFELYRVFLGLLHKHRGVLVALAARTIYILAAIWNTGMLAQGAIRGRISRDYLTGGLRLARHMVFGLPLLNNAYSTQLAVRSVSNAGLRATQTGM